MAEICAPHPWARAQSRPSNGDKIKSILLLSSLCSIFALREIPDLLTKQTRIISVVYSKTEDQTASTENKKNHHNHVLLNTNERDSSPYASPERPVTAPSGKCQRRLTVGPLGAAMRLTAMRQPYESPRPKNPRQPKAIPGLTNDSSPQLTRYSKPNSASTGKGENAGPCYAPYGGAPHTAPGPARTDPPPDLLSSNVGPCKLPTRNTKTNNLFHRLRRLTNTRNQTIASRTCGQDSMMQPRGNREGTVRPHTRVAPHLPAYPHPFPEISSFPGAPLPGLGNTITLPITLIYKLLPGAPLPAKTGHLKELSCALRPDNWMQPREIWSEPEPQALDTPRPHASSHNLPASIPHNRTCSYTTCPDIKTKNRKKGPSAEKQKRYREWRSTELRPPQNEFLGTPAHIPYT